MREQLQHEQLRRDDLGLGARAAMGSAVSDRSGHAIQPKVYFVRELWLPSDEATRARPCQGGGHGLTSGPEHPRWPGRVPVRICASGDELLHGYLAYVYE